jgi:iron-sulfur cluster assembly protein
MSVSIQNPNNIELGIQVTSAAEQRILHYLASNNAQNLRLSLKKTGCSGWSYVMDYVQAPKSDDVIFPLQGDHHICVDKASYPYLKGLTMDYVKQGLIAKFVFQNPNQTGECGCGESFSVEK